MALKSIIVTVQGQDIELEYNSATGYYEKSINAGPDSSFPQSGGYFPVSVKATDDTDLSTTIGSETPNLRLFVAEKHKPQITIITPGSDGYLTDDVTPEIKFEIYDNKVQTSGYSGVDKDSVVLKIDGVAVASSAISFEATSGGFIGTYTPTEALANGTRTITVDGADYDGNAAETASVSFEIDNQAPGLDVNAPGIGYVTSKSVVTVSGTATDKNKPVTVKIAVNDGDEVTVPVDNTTGVFSHDVELTQTGENVIRVTAYDALNNKSTTIERIVKYNTTAPKFEEVGILYDDKQVTAVNKVPAGGQYLIRCKVTTS